MSFQRIQGPRHAARSPRRARHATIIAGLALFGIVAGASIGIGIARNSALDSYSGCTVTEREDRALAQLAERAPRVYTDCGVFVVGDEPFRFHFTSADVYNQLTPGAKVDLTTVGWRVGPVSWFPNVIEVSS